MHILIITDLEGISCVDSIDMIDESREGYRLACEYLMSDTNAAVEGAFSGGASRVTVVDGHGGGKNFIPAMLDPRAEHLPASAFSKNPPLDYDAFLCIGAHAMAGTENAFLDHTQNSTKWFEYCINGTPQGEMAQQAFFLGHYAIPLVMASGDAAACREAQDMVPEIATATVKTADGRNRAVCLPMEEARELIRRAAEDGVRRAKEIKPLKLTLPAELKLTFCRNDYCDAAMHAGVKRHGRTLIKTVESIETYLDLAKL